jgi:hypothetical protein
MVACQLILYYQAADRRDRLIYVLSQINAARGDDAMQVEEESSDESSEDEVRAFGPCFVHLTYIYFRSKNFTPQAH